MFNVCPGCGEFTEVKEVVDAPTRAICPKCHHEHRFLSLPLYVVTGASGSGKTTAGLEMAAQNQNFVVLDQDILWNDAFNQPDNDFANFRNTWLRMIKNIHQSGRSVVLFGSVIPQQLESCTERRYIGDIHYLALVCEASELERRLKARPNWRNSGSDDNLKRMVEFNKWLIDNASESQPNIHNLDTTSSSVSETVDSICKWIEDCS